MQKGEKLLIDGKEYEFLEQTIKELPNGERLQISEYKVKKEDGTFSYPSLACKVPKGFEYLELSSLNEDCLKRLANGSTEVEKKDFASK